MLDALFGNGKLEIHLSTRDFTTGETIEGSVSYALDEPTSARGLVVGLRAKQRILTRTRSSEGGTGVANQSRTVYEFKNELSGEKTYTSGDADFTLLVPTDALSRGVSPPEGLLGDIARAASFLSGETRFPLEWEVFAYIDIPWRLNVKKNVAITVSEAPPRIRIG